MRFSSLIATAFAATVLSGGASNAAGLTPQDYAEKGVAASTEFSGYAGLCDLEMSIRNVNIPRVRKPQSNRSGGGQGQRSRFEPKEPLPPMQVFDNLYFLGTHSVTAWLYGTPEGYVLIDGLTNDEEAAKVILGGMRTLGLDPNAIRHVLVTHGHGDHYGGADYIAETLGVDVMMSKADWDLVATLGTHPRFGPAPEQGTTVLDGQVLRVGTSELTIHLAPGHTPGTISPIFEVMDNGHTHMAMLWGGTGFNFGPDVAIFRTYAASAAKMRDLSRKAGVDVILSNHVRRAETDRKMAELANRASGTAHPFVLGQAGYALFDVLENCAMAQALRFAE